MLIDWFTVAAQILNFLILVWLLKRFLYRPILNAIDTREQKIADKLSEAADVEKQAIQMREHFRALNEEFESHYEQKQQAVELEMQEKRTTLLEKAQEDMDQLRQKELNRLNEETQKLILAIRNRGKDAFFSVLSKSLSDLANASLEEQIMTVFLARLESEEINEARQALMQKQKLGSVVVQTGFDLSPDHQERIRAAVHDFIGRKVEVGFKVNERLIGGIKLIVEDQEIAWSIDRYLAALEKKVDEKIIT